MSESHLSVFAESLEIGVADLGHGQPFLLLHGGAGRYSMMNLADSLAIRGRAIVPIHPGFNGEPRPVWFSSVEHLALAYLQLVERLDLENVIVIGNSLGGWIAAEMALHHSPRVAGIILINSVGISPLTPDNPIVNLSTVPITERANYSFHNPARFASQLLDSAAIQNMQSNQQTMSVFAGAHFMHDPTLLERLAGIRCKAMVAWGESDRIVDGDYGQRFAAAIPGAGFELVAEAGHFPHIENPKAVERLIERFVSSQAD